jgi:hypothetical protein
VLGNAFVTLADGSSIADNRAGNGSGGGIEISEGATLDIRGGCSIVNNSCIHGVGGGIAVCLYADGLQFVGTGVWMVMQQVLVGAPPMLV